MDFEKDLDAQVMLERKNPYDIAELVYYLIKNIKEIKDIDNNMFLETTRRNFDTDMMHISIKKSRFFFLGKVSNRHVLEAINPNQRYTAIYIKSENINVLADVEYDERCTDIPLMTEGFWTAIYYKASYNVPKLRYYIKIKKHDFYISEEQYNSILAACVEKRNLEENKAVLDTIKKLKSIKK